MSIRITLVKREKPYEKNVDTDLEWLCSCLGFCRQSQQKTGSDLFKELVRNTSQGKPPTSTQLSGNVGMSRGAVIHQLNRLAEAGLIRKDGRKYYLREGSMYRTIKEVERDIQRMFEDLEQMALEIDEELGFKRRERTL